jgi:exopolysaccharide biosynthesis polyprenyl glycosylphosphotransferase
LHSPPIADAPLPSRKRRPSLPPMLRFRREALESAPEAIQERLGLKEVERRDRTYRKALASSDIIAALIALALVSLVGSNTFTPAVLLTLPLVVVVAKLQGLYDRDELLLRKTTIDEAPKLFQLATLFTLGFWMLADVLFDGPLQRSQAAILCLGLFCCALLARRLTRLVVGRSVATERCMFIGDSESYERLRGKLELSSTNAELIGRMNLQRSNGDGDGNGNGNGHAHFASEQQLRELLKWARVHRLIIEPQTLPPQEALDLVRAAKSTGIRVSLLPRVLDVVGTSVVFDQLDGMTVLGVRRFGLTRSSRAVKRAFDLAGACLILVAVGPAMALMALAIKLDSRGPVFFRQTRVGRNGNQFLIFKFRTMIDEAEALKAELARLNECEDGLFKIEQDPRVTRVGRLLRRTSLDELPQLFNVVLGDMSLVGPRPLVVDEDSQITGWDRRRLQLTPGMTGPWQIAGSSRVPLGEMVKMDYLYVAGWSLWEDMKILVRTVPYVLARRGM